MQQHVAGTCKEALTAAMETIRSSDVDEWLKNNCGTSMLAKRRQAFALRGAHNLYE